MELKGTHSMQLLSHVPVLINQTRDLLLQTVILFHQQLIHRSQLPINCLKTRSFLPLLFTTSNNVNIDLSKRKK